MIDTGTLIYLITAGLPNHLSDKIDRETLEQTEDLYDYDIRKIEHLVMKNKYEKKNYTHSDIKTKKNEKKIPCQICVNEKKGKRFHPKEKCWFNVINQKYIVKSVNNSELEVEINEENQKN